MGSFCRTLAALEPVIGRERDPRVSHLSERLRVNTIHVLTNDNINTHVVGGWEPPGLEGRSARCIE